MRSYYRSKRKSRYFPFHSVVYTDNIEEPRTGLVKFYSAVDCEFLSSAVPGSLWQYEYLEAIEVTPLLVLLFPKIEESE